MDIYLFNWTNPGDIKDLSTKPNFQQLGPFRFREYPDKTNIKFDDNHFVISYRKLSFYYFEAENSNGSLSDLCTTVNMVAIGAGNYAKNDGYFKQKFAVSGALATFNQKLHVTKTIAELLFDGYEDGMIKLSTIFNNDTPFDKVGFFVKKNGTDLLSGNYTASTGVDDISKLDNIVKYNNLTEFPYYEGECKKLKGSPGEFFPPNPSIAKPVYLFTPDMCRSIPYEYEKDIELNGLKGLRFAAGVRALDNGTIYEENKCFATDESMASGVMNVSICNYGHPMFMSFPHFYGSDPSYLEAVSGLEPVNEKHQAFITFEPVRKNQKLSLKADLYRFQPQTSSVQIFTIYFLTFQTTGITLEVSARFQTNVLLRQYGDHISLFQGVPRIFMPQFWVEQKFVMDSEKSGQIKLALDIPWIGQIVGIVMMLIGIILMSISHLRRLCCQTHIHSMTPLSKTEEIEKGTVIKIFEMNPLITQKPQC